MREATVVATKQSRKIIRNGLLRSLIPPRNDEVMLVLVSYNMFDKNIKKKSTKQIIVN
ncbi:hypothetical protein [Candidatus Tisiphia endosymbiont of Hybos culiciformis]|uniref:hypothetical protein n=1 Tax=Candidatus Tisiphia endosymbiont of Hybos culiciformis TaxID=3139331 RepID=UPI003CCA747A